MARGRGVAVANRDETMAAAIADVEVNRTSGKVTVKRITLAQDCGLIVNPDGVKNQIEGNVIQGVSRTLLEEVKFDASGIKTLDWLSYPILHFPDIPEIDIVLDQPARHALRWAAANHPSSRCQRRLPTPSSTRWECGCGKCP